MHKHLEKMGEVTFDKIFNQKLGECMGQKSCQRNLTAVIPASCLLNESACGFWKKTNNVRLNIFVTYVIASHKERNYFPIH